MPAAEGNTGYVEIVESISVTASWSLRRSRPDDTDPADLRQSDQERGDARSSLLDEVRKACAVAEAQRPTTGGHEDPNKICPPM